MQLFYKDQPAKQNTAMNGFSASYRGGLISIPEGAWYYTDARGDVIIGWHGSYNPPMDMDGVSMLFGATGKPVEITNRRPSRF